MTSSYEMLCVTELLLPQASVAVYVRMKDISPEQLKPLSTSSNVTSTEEQLSVAVGASGIASPHWRTTSASIALNTGASSSTTVMLCIAVELFPQASVKVYSRTTSKQPAWPSSVDDVSIQVTVTSPEQLSEVSYDPNSADESYSEHDTVASVAAPVGASSSTNVMT